MKSIAPLAGPLCVLALTAVAAQPGLTIYNGDFAVARETVPLNLKAGVNPVEFVGTPMQVEPDSVVLRDPSGKHTLNILEQNYRADPVSQDLLLSLFVGKTINFESYRSSGGQAAPVIIQGKIIRASYAPHSVGMPRYGGVYAVQQARMSPGVDNTPIIEVNGELRFGLPGTPLFPALGDDTILKPTLSWLIRSDEPGRFDAELSYITGGLSWEADYNLMSPEKGNTLELVGWVTLANQCGKTFQDARIKLMAGEVSRVQPPQVGLAMARSASLDEGGAGVSEKAFDEYHLYTLERPTTLRDRETTQVEFVHAAGIDSTLLYYFEARPGGFRPFVGSPNLSQNPDSDSNTKIQVIREFKNSAANHLGMPLPRGRMRFYRSDDRQLEFVGESLIDHTPRDETIRVATGNAFDLTGERKRTEYNYSPGQKALDESFEIKLRNHKDQEVEIRVVEHLDRWNNWQIIRESDTHLKKDAQTIEYLAQVPANGERTVTYTVHYSW